MRRQSGGRSRRQSGGGGRGGSPARALPATRFCAISRAACARAALSSWFAISDACPPPRYPNGRGGGRWRAWRWRACEDERAGRRMEQRRGPRGTLHRRREGGAFGAEKLFSAGKNIHVQKRSERPHYLFWPARTNMEGGGSGRGTNIYACWRLWVRIPLCTCDSFCWGKIVASSWPRKLIHQSNVKQQPKATFQLTVELTRPLPFASAHMLPGCIVRSPPRTKRAGLLCSPAGSELHQRG